MLKNEHHFTVMFFFENASVFCWKKIQLFFIKYNEIRNVLKMLSNMKRFVGCDTVMEAGWAACYLFLSTIVIIALAIMLAIHFGKCSILIMLMQIQKYPASKFFDLWTGWNLRDVSGQVRIPLFRFC